MSDIAKRAQIAAGLKKLSEGFRLLAEQREEARPSWNDYLAVSVELSSGFMHLDMIVTWTRIYLDPEDRRNHRAREVLEELLDDAREWLDENETPTPDFDSVSPDSEKGDR